MTAKTFDLNGVKFYEYHVRDSHGSRCDTWLVDGKSVSLKEFDYAINKALHDNSSWHTIRNAIIREEVDNALRSPRG